MDYFSICAILKEYRKRAGLSQAALCEGLCELPTMNKIENGKQNPNKKLLDALIERLQIPLALNIAISKIEFERAIIEKEISSKLSHNDCDINDLLRQYKSVSSEMNKFELQFYLYSHAVFIYNTEKNYKVALDELNKSIKITFPNYTNEANFDNHIFTSLEFLILNNIAICTYFTKDFDKAISLMKKIMVSLEARKNFTDIYAKKYPMIAYNLSTWLGIKKHYAESLEVSQKGIDCCLKYQQYSSISDLFYNHGYTFMMLGEKEKGKEFLKKSLAFDSIFDRKKFIDSAKSDIIKSFGTIFLSDLQNFKIPL